MILKNITGGCPTRIERIWLNEKKILEVDHPEQYITKCKNYIILVNSPYQHIEIDHYIKNGWILIDKIYNGSAYTFIKIFLRETINRKNPTFIWTN